MKESIFKSTLQSYVSKTAVLAILLLIGTTLNAQVAFYLRPTVNMKTNQSSFGTEYQMNTYNSVTNEHFTFVNRPMFLDGHIDLGINVGIQIKEKHFIELGISSDHSSIGRSLLTHSNFNDYETGENYTSNSYSHTTVSPFYARISADYHNNFWNNKKGTIGFRSIAGIGFLFSGNSKLQINGSGHGNGNLIMGNDDYGTGITGDNDIQQIAPDVFITDYVSKIETYDGVTASVKLGLGIDFSTKKDFHLFSFDVSYLLSTRPVQFQETKITVIDNGFETNYRYNQSSRGSGLYFTLSRRFQFYPWKPIIKKQQL
ncbi:hypothetical protein ERX46_09035 [Brumimicrobium glaciale]|uniref:Outer membrane protein beta-barrel domain-containing protein n=1 Tax=Brumimicrobium glaciale TaxID=200475 RepID=A0A4Q4KL31_9FLAO|nr:hypothetical protein [Brumimicrobium glaciale]RYM34093.1 hypothetical protein ERX46_09035 [Brumimicrobium glaciale]